MRPLITAIAVVAVASLPVRGEPGADTQMSGVQRGVSQGPQNVVRPAPPPPMPTPPPTPPQTVAPPITFPLPPLMRPPAGGLLPRPGEGIPFRTRPRYGPFVPFYSPYVSGYGYGYGYGYGAPEDLTDPNRARPTPAPATGLLRLDVTPMSAQVFIDSYYVGTVADINAQKVLQLDAGPHRLEIRAPQYQTVSVDVRILPYETITYRATLEPVRAATAPPPPPAARAAQTTMYMIPNCYLGNIPPRANRLPPGCDIKQVQVLGPK